MAKHSIPVEDMRLMRQAAHIVGKLHTDILFRNAAARGTAIVLKWQGAELRRRSAEIGHHAAMLRGDSLELRQWAAGCRVLGMGDSFQRVAMDLNCPLHHVAVVPDQRT